MVRLTTLALMVFAALALQGCAALALSAVSAVAGTGVSLGAGHAIDSITYKTFSVPLGELSRATMTTLDRLDMPVLEFENTDDGQTITAQAGDREIDIELDRLTTATTRMRVVAKKNWLIRDRATATEIILQTDRTLSEPSPPAVVSAPKPTKPVARTTQRCPKGGTSC